MRVLKPDSEGNIYRSLYSKGKPTYHLYPNEIRGLGHNFRPTGEFFDSAYFDVPGSKSSYDGYVDDGRWGPVADKIIEIFNPTSILDFGSAKGFLVKELLKRGIDAYCADISKYAFETAPESVASRFLLLEDHRIPLDDRSIDLCVSRDVLEHMPEDQLDSVILEIMRISQRQFFAVTGGNTVEEQEYARMNDISHVTIRPEEWWIDRLLRLGYLGAFVLNIPRVISKDKPELLIAPNQYH